MERIFGRELKPVRGDHRISIRRQQHIAGRRTPNRFLGCWKSQLSEVCASTTMGKSIESFCRKHHAKIGRRCVNLRLDECSWLSTCISSSENPASGLAGGVTAGLAKCSAYLLELASRAPLSQSTMVLAHISTRCLRHESPGVGLTARNITGIIRDAQLRTLSTLHARR